MSATNNFIQIFSIEHARVRSELAKKLATQQAELLDSYCGHINQVDAAQERYIAFVEPIVAGLSGLPDEVVIEAIKQNPGGAPEVILSALPGMSMSSLLMDYPAAAFVINSGGKAVEPDATKEGQHVYSGLIVSIKTGTVHWQSIVGGQLVNIALQTNDLGVERWNNPVETGMPVADVALGDSGASAPWQEFGQHGSNYWVQPSSPQALALLEKAKAWKKNATLSTELREEFNKQLSGIPALHSAQAKIVVNALFAWAECSGQELPSKEDFAVWTPPRGNVLAMHSAQDWSNLVADTPKKSGLANSAQEKIHIMSGRLPNIWRFADETIIAVLCSAMAETRTRLVADQSLGP